jgi:2-polyprenyl-3-methyl-5-hydroxy-6-metoxy-1,4-benzoquinol methylase
MLTTEKLDDFARRYYLADDVVDHRLENRMQIDSAARLLSRLEPGSSVLELGYGDGLLTNALREAGFDADLLEGSPLLCARATALHGPGLRIHHALFEQFRPTRLYDAVLALHVLEHVDQPVHLLQHIAQWVRPGGVVVLVVPNRSSIHRRIALQMGLITALDELSPRDHLVGHQRVYDLAALTRDVTTAGLIPQAQFGSFLKVLPNSMMLSYSNDLLKAIDAVSAELPPELLANIGLTARRPELSTEKSNLFPSKKRTSNYR